MKAKTKAIVWLKRTATALGCALSLCSANRLAAQTPSPEDILAEFCRSEPARPLPAVEIIIDDSGSMQGFLRSNNGGRLVKVIQSLNSSLAGSTPLLSRLNELGKPIRITDIVREKFYDEESTPLAAAFWRVRDDKMGKIFVIITDLVQPENNVNEVCSAMKEAIEGSEDDAEAQRNSRGGKAPREKRDVLIVGFRSAFSSQINPKCSPNCSPEKHGPLYAIVIAPNGRVLRQFEDKVNLRASTVDDSPPLYLYGSGPAIEVMDIGAVPSGSGKWRVGPVFRGPCRKEGGWGIGAYASVNGPGPLQLRLTARVLIRLQRLSTSNVKIIPPRTLGDFSKPSVKNNWRERFLYLDTDRLEFTYSLAYPPAVGSHVYRIQYTTDPEALRVPDWVAKWSGEPPVYVKKGVRLTSALRSVVTEILETVDQRPMLDHFVVISRRP